MRNNKRISVYGKMRSGKDTVADLITLKGGVLTTQIAYGDKMKEHYHSIFGYNGSEKDREGYQWFGQAMRSWVPSIWVDSLEATIRNIDDGRRIIVTDMRQPNEFDHLKERGFIMIKVETPDHIRMERMNERGEVVTDKELNHETEKNVDKYDYDYRIINDGSLEDLKRKVQTMLRGCGGD